MNWIHVIIWKTLLWHWNRLHTKELERHEMLSDEVFAPPEAVKKCGDRLYELTNKIAVARCEVERLSR